MPKLKLLVTGVLVWSLAAHGVEAPPEDLALLKTVTLSRNSVGNVEYPSKIKGALLQLAQEHPEVVAARAALVSSETEIDASKAARYPRLSIGTASGRSSYTGSSPVQSYTVYSASVRMSLLDAGGMGARVRAAEAQAGAQGEALKTSVQKVLLDALTTYLQVQRFNLKRTVAERSSLALDELAKVEQKRVDLGAAGQNDARVASARKATFVAKQQEFGALYSESVAKFESYFKFTPDPGALPILTVPRAWEISSQSEALRIAEVTSTDLTEARGRLERAKALVDREKSGQFPTLDGVFTRTRDPRGFTPEPTRTALEVNWAVGSVFDVQARIKTALAEVSNQEARVESIRLNLVETASGAWNRVVAVREREKQLQLATEEAFQAYQGRQRLVAFGRETMINVLDAQAEYYSVMLDWVDAFFDARISELRLARATGRLQLDSVGGDSWVGSILAGANSRSPLFANLKDTVCVGKSTACVLMEAGGVNATPVGASISLRVARQLSPAAQ